MEIEDVIFFLALGLILGFGGFIIGSEFIGSKIDIRLDQEVADDICQQLTNNSVAVALNEFEVGMVKGGKLICNIPSFDATQNIIIRTNSE